MNNQDIVSRDLSVVWHPCTQMKDHESLPLIPVKRASGVYLEDFEGRQYLDAISSWWVNLFGHGNQIIGNAVKNQLDQLDHVLLAGFTHQPVVELSEKLVQITPPGLSRCFYADNGSSAVEVALKMSFHYWLNQGKPAKKSFVNLENSYHGETIGALSVGDVSLYKKTYSPLLLEVLTVPSPDSYLKDEGQTDREFAEQQFEKMEALLAACADEICAVIIEPMVQCAAGMRMYHPIYLAKLREACDRYQVHLIADEIAVGFGRTGTMFACEQANISPDFMCLSKGLTGGYLPLSVVLTTDSVYSAFYEDYEKMRAFLHSHSYTGNPLGCAAALATLEIFRQDDVINSNRKASQHMASLIEPLRSHPHVADVRQCGMIAAIELAKNVKTREAYPWQERRGLRVYQHALQRGVLLRPLGNVIYFMPPYVINEEQMEYMVSVASEGIALATRD